MGHINDHDVVLISPFLAQTHEKNVSGASRHHPDLTCLADGSVVYKETWGRDGSLDFAGMCVSGVVEIGIAHTSLYIAQVQRGLPKDTDTYNMQKDPRIQEDPK